MKVYLKLFILIFAVTDIISCAGMAASAEEYYSIGMAYFDMAQGSTARREEYFREAEKWLNRAKQADRTMLASQYNLGRLAFEMQRFDEAAEHFESILTRDPDNVMALRAAAYSRIKSNDINIAENHYSKLLELVGDSIDDGYNHALVLYAMEQYGKVEIVLEQYPYALRDNADILLLYARSQKAQDKVESLNSYLKWLESNSDITVRSEYADLLVKHEYYARAIEEYQLILQEEFSNDTEPQKNHIHFSLAKVLLIADAESGDGITELQTAVTEGFDDIEALELLLQTEGISASNLLHIRVILDELKKEAEFKDTNSEHEDDLEHNS